MPRGVYARYNGIHALQVAAQQTYQRHAVGHNRGLKAIGAFLLKESQKIVPYETWYLHDSGYTRTRGRGYNAYQETGYQAYYAIWQHENLQWQHKPGRSAKYLEIPARKYRDRMRAIYRKHAIKKTGRRKR